MSLRVLHLLSQRPGRTGSGVTLDALVRHGNAAGHEQRVLVGTPAEDPQPVVGDLPSGQVTPLTFGAGALGSDLPGMSDVMPYVSSRFTCLEPGQVEDYRRAWRQALEQVIQDFRPQVVHSHHIWLLSSWVKDWLPETTPVLTHCHATGFRQMRLCPHLAEPVIRGCARNEAFCVLHGGHAVELAQTLGVASERIHRIGAGYREDLFHCRGRSFQKSKRMLFVGKLSQAKGLPSLLDAFAAMMPEEGAELWVVGSGGAPESEALLKRMAGMARVRMFGAVDQARLADLMRQVDVCVLPSFYEGLPLVLVEAQACGCRLVASDLEGIRRELAPGLGDTLSLVSLPTLRGVDEPEPAALGAFAADLRRACTRALAAGPVRPDAEFLKGYSWAAVFSRVEQIWKDLVR